MAPLETSALSPSTANYSADLSLVDAIEKAAYSYPIVVNPSGSLTFDAVQNVNLRSFGLSKTEAYSVSVLN